MIKHCIRLTVSAILSALISACATSPEQSLYDEIGGHKTLNTIYGVAITRIYTDPVIGHYFKGVPKKHLRDQLVLQTCELIGGPCEYDGKSMEESHKDLNIKEREFYILVEYVQGAMRDVGLTYQQENRILKKLAPIKYETVYL
ncbi:group I truncated hemoglobin [Alteromonas mediterranea]|uniref:Globin n=1 Tax=Alteromonas mediterranea TaxID=314275 RepID=A0AAC9ACS2_9ALTE|nr:group 1 truncated hemoglobin [Alteromonas mediterranea]AGP92588.1 globin family protein [Alteromonas mediterranea U8]AFV84326.1 globin family protein [Alteromonas mediterranea DE1]AGP84589.1 globin family protein [Alteromonas mediterranea U4]AGP88706.1 globin family protein [Alteromonas mediterranea U7]AGP96334.1 globin family protein [Alteromonas mediterranea UM7]|tara:strand:- start:97 stop:528 length:432 start_codon:yes stop_codon:yes gene_type:complete